MNRTLHAGPARRLAGATRALAKGLLGIALVALATLVFVPDVLAAPVAIRAEVARCEAALRVAIAAPGAPRGRAAAPRTRPSVAVLAERD